MREADQIEEEAARWVAREDRGITSDESEAFSSWMAQTPNRVAYLRLKGAWEKSRRLAALQGSIPAARRMMAGFGIGRVMAAAAVILILAAGAFVALHFYRASAATQEIIYATQAGERPTLHLLDGTQIQLDANSRLRATISPSSRTVVLEKGEAYFEVVHDADRPFVVIAGKHRISDLGTKFSVREDGEDIRVVVTEGRVKVDNASLLTPESPVFADRGNVVVAKADETILSALTDQEIKNDLEWREGRIFFDHKNLGDAVEEFNRYNSRQLVVTGVARDIKIGGSFRADNIDVFVSLIRKPLGLAVEERGNKIVLSKK